MKNYLLILLIFTTSPAFSDWSPTKFLINKMPLGAKPKNDIKQFFSAQIQASKMGLACFTKAANQPQALDCAIKMDTLVANQIEEKQFNLMQESMKHIQWNKEQKNKLLNDIRLDLHTQQLALNCVSKVITVGDLELCFKDKVKPEK